MKNLQPGTKLIDGAGRTLVIKGDSDQGSHLMDIYFNPPLDWCTEQTMHKTYLQSLTVVE